MAKARRRVRTKRKVQSKSAISPVMVGIVAAAAILIVGGLIWLGYQGGQNVGGPVDASQFPALGDVNAPVTLIEFSDYG